MDKKELKFYEAPAMDVVVLKANAALMAGSPKGMSSDDFGDGEGGDGFVDPEA